MQGSTQFDYYLYDNGDSPFASPYSFKFSNKKLSSLSSDNKLTVVLDISGSMAMSMTGTSGSASNRPPVMLRAMTTTSPPSPPSTPPSLPLPSSGPMPMLRAVTCGGGSSSYMTATGNTRLDIAKEAIIKLVYKLMDTNITLTIITFSDTAKIIYQGSINESIISIVSSIKIEGGTNIGSGLELASTLPDSDIVLLSDGEDTYSTNFTPYQNKITCIGIGKKDTDWDYTTLATLDKYSEPSSAETSSALRNRIMSLALGLATSFAKNVEISLIGGTLKSSANQEDGIIKIADWGDGQSIFGSIVPTSESMTLHVSFMKDGHHYSENHPITTDSIIHNKIIYEQIKIYNDVTSMITKPELATDDDRVSNMARMNSFLKLHRSDSFGILEPLQKSIRSEMRDKGAANICSLLRETSSALSRQVTQSSYLESFDEEEEGINTECVICYSETRKVVLRPCQHMCACISCAQTLLQQKKQCPICRTIVQKIDIIDEIKDKCVVCVIKPPTRYLQDVVSKCITHCETCYPKDQRTIRVKFP